MNPPAPILRESDAIAFPAFRNLFWIAGSLNDTGPAHMADRLASWFWKTHGSGATRATILDEGVQIENAAPAGVLPKVKAWLDGRDKPYGACLMLSGGPAVEAGDEAPEAERPPHLRIEEGAACVIVDVSLPPDVPDPAAQADAIAAFCACEGMVCGLQGMGYLLAPEMDSMVAQLPRAHSRYRAAIELRATDVPDGLMVDGSAVAWEDMPGVLPGLPDIGWRTWIGAPFRNRLTLPPDVMQVAHPHGLMVQAGPAPSWGDVNAGQDVPGFSVVAAALADIMMPAEVAHLVLFGGTADDPDLADRVDSYLARFTA